MGCNARNDEILENLERMRYDREAYEDALVRFNACRVSPTYVPLEEFRATYLRLSIGRGGRI